MNGNIIVWECSLVVEFLVNSHTENTFQFMRVSLLALFIAGFASVHAQVRRQPDAAKIKLDLKKLNSLGAVLYMAAHPDDENTRVIAYLVNDRLITTGYLSLTRGDGGQNLIGPEIRDLL